MKALTVFVILITLWSTSKCQHFCDSFLFSGHEVNVHTVRKQDYCLLIIGDKYWRIERKGWLTLTLKAEKPFGSSERLKNYSFGLDWESASVIKNRTVYRLVPGFYNRTTKSVDQISFNKSGVLQLVEENIKLDPINGLENVTFILGYNEAISRRFNSGNQSFEYKVVFYEMKRKTEKGFIEVKYWSDISQHFKENYEYYLKNGYHFVGECRGEILFSNNVSIVYCTQYGNCYEGEEGKKLLIDCEEWYEKHPTTTTTTSTSTTTSTHKTTIKSMMTSRPTTKPKTIWTHSYVKKVLIICFVVFIVIALLLIVCFRTNSEDTEA